MTEKYNYEEGKIYAYNYGYNMVLYQFVKVIRVTEKSVYYQEYANRVDNNLTTDCFRPFVLPDLSKPVGKIECKRLSTYIGWEWNGEPLQEDHLD